MNIFNVSVIRSDELNSMIDKLNNQSKIVLEKNAHVYRTNFISKLPIDDKIDIDSLFKLSSSSELHQDIFALAMNNFELDGYFVEIGAANGISLSNTYMLEKHFRWRGILVEPAKANKRELIRNRSNCHISFECIWDESNLNLLFKETEDSLALSTVKDLADLDLHSKSRKFSKHYKVKTETINDLLMRFDAPKKINYLSIDTEGSEFRILSKLDFEKYKFNVITVEHNYTDQRVKLHNLLSTNGYQRVFEELSDYDDWYIFNS